MEDLIDEYNSIQAEINQLSGRKNNNKTSNRCPYKNLICYSQIKFHEKNFLEARSYS